ncbi:TPA: hypothetical protein P1858_003603 [Salmonella enterica subsp. enterica serovar Chester]|nr:hypothetical protein [Salmonella enterica subsp. enterica serovar Chester]
MKVKKTLLSGFILSFLTTPVLAEKHSLSLGYATGFLVTILSLVTFTPPGISKPTASEKSVCL